MARHIYATTKQVFDVQTQVRLHTTSRDYPTRPVEHEQITNSVLAGHLPTMPGPAQEPAVMIPTTPVQASNIEPAVKEQPHKPHLQWQPALLNHLSYLHRS